jgi:serine/threonine protein kinase
MTESSKAPTLIGPPRASQPSLRLASGTTLAGKYVVERTLAQGGIGVVIAAHHTQLDRRVAIKYLQRGFLEPKSLVERFTREAQLSAKIRSEHVVRVHDVATDERIGPYMVMEFLEGEDLHETLCRGRVLIPTAVDFIIQACDALAEAHALGIVHRDLKPANLFLARRAGGSSMLKVIDFGISKSGTARGAAGTGQHRTTGNETFGTPVYMSPEQLRSLANVDARADIWALGVVLFELLTGDVPFLGEGLPEVCTSILKSAPRSLRALLPEAPAELESVILRCLEKDVGKRYRNVAELVQELQPFAPRGATHRIEHIKRIVRELDSSRPPPLKPGGEPREDTALQRAADAEAEDPTGSAIPRERRWGILVGAVVALVVGAGALAILRAAGTTRAASVAKPAATASVIPTSTASAEATESAPPSPVRSSTPWAAVAAPNSSVNVAAPPVSARAVPAPPRPRPHGHSDYDEFGERR